MLALHPSCFWEQPSFYVAAAAAALAVAVDVAAAAFAVVVALLYS